MESVATCTVTANANAIVEAEFGVTVAFAGTNGLPHRQSRESCFDQGGSIAVVVRLGLAFGIGIRYRYRGIGIELGLLLNCGGVGR